MSKLKIVLRCPYCDWSFEVEPPDRLHSAYSFEKPLKGSYYSQVIERNLVCQNQECRKPLTLYWYAATNYFDRV